MHEQQSSSKDFYTLVQTRCNTYNIKIWNIDWKVNWYNADCQQLAYMSRMTAAPRTPANWSHSSSTVRMTACVFHYSGEQEETLRTTRSHKTRYSQLYNTEWRSGDEVIVKTVIGPYFKYYNLKCEWHVERNKGGAVCTSFLLRHFPLNITAGIKSGHRHALSRTALHPLPHIHI